MISKKEFIMVDVNNNTFFNGKIYILDSSSYFEEGREEEIIRLIFPRRKRNILEDNISTVKHGIYNLISKEIVLNKKADERMIDLFSNINTFNKKLGEDETIKQYILRK